jgi:hypothetical protein
MSECPYSVRDIIVSKLKRLGCGGLASPDADCGCGIDDLAPCGGSCLDCLPARSRVTSEGIGWFAVGFVKRPQDTWEPNPSDQRPPSGGPVDQVVGCEPSNTEVG